MPGAREWVRRGGWAEGQPWHLRPVAPPARRSQSSTAACGMWFSSGDVLALWGDEDGPSTADRCAVCDAASEALEALDARPWAD